MGNLMFDIIFESYEYTMVCIYYRHIYALFVVL